MNKCKYCDHNLDDGAAFCPNCGKEQADAVEGNLEETALEIEPEALESTKEENTEQLECGAEETTDEVTEEVTSEVTEETTQELHWVEHTVEKTAPKVEVVSSAKELSNKETSADGVEQWVAPPDPYKIKKRRKRNIIIAAVVVLVLAIAAGAFLLFGKNQGSERPLLYVSQEEVLKIKTRNTPQAVELGNQGFTLETNYMPILVSDDNKQIAYLTEKNSLFSVPVKNATGEVIEPEYMVEENVRELLGFAPDNSGTVYYLDQNKVLKSYNGKTYTEISDKIVEGIEGINMPIFYAFANNRIVYYEGSVENLVLCTEVVGKPNSKDTIENVQTVNVIEPDDEGIFYFTTADSDSALGSFYLHYFSFKNRTTTDLGSADYLAKMLYTNPSTGTAVTSELMPESAEAVRAMYEEQMRLQEEMMAAQIKAQEEAAAAEAETPETEEVPEAPLEENEEVTTEGEDTPEATIEKQSNAYYKEGQIPLTNLSADAAPKEEATEEPAEEVAELQEETEADQTAQVNEIELDEDEMAGGIAVNEQPVYYYGVYMYKDGERIALAENIGGQVYIGENGNFIVYDKPSADNTNMGYYYQNIAGGVAGEPVELYNVPQDKGVNFVEDPENGTFAMSVYNDDYNSVTAKVYTLGKAGEITGEDIIDENAFILYDSVVDGQYVVIKDVVDHSDGNDLKMLGDLYTYKKGAYNKIAGNVSVFTVGNSGVENPDVDDVILFIRDVEGAAGTLSYYDGKKVHTMVANFIVPKSNTSMPLVFVNPKLTYYLVESVSGMPTLMVYEKSKGTSVVEENVLGLL